MGRGTLHIPLWAQIWLIVLSLTLVWGSTFILVKWTLTVLNPLQVFGSRIVLATLFILPFSFRRLPALPRRELPKLALFGLLANLVSPLLFATAQTRIESSMTGMLNTLTPVLTLFVGALVYGERVRRMHWIGLLLGLCGSLLLLSERAGPARPFDPFAGIALLAMISNGFTINMLKFNLRGYAALQIASAAFLTVFPLALAVVLGTGVVPELITHPGGLRALLWLVLLAALANVMGLILMGKLVQLSSPVFTSMVTYLMPLVAIAWGLLDGEPIMPLQWFSMGVILLSVWAVNYADVQNTARSANSAPGSANA
ncbi:MAG: DMT family transporter [Bacteroidia bacterium]|nr:DMT family transporter [Bacteroidia bacterium]